MGTRGTNGIALFSRECPVLYKDDLITEASGRRIAKSSPESFTLGNPF
ncbi:hypothetical protein AVEN_132342-1, partial [Araneus ventricosus]